jgi:hypothetical protein
MNDIKIYDVQFQRANMARRSGGLQMAEKEDDEVILQPKHRKKSKSTPVSRAIVRKRKAADKAAARAARVVSPEQRRKFNQKVKKWRAEFKSKTGLSCTPTVGNPVNARIRMGLNMPLMGSNVVYGRGPVTGTMTDKWKKAQAYKLSHMKRKK